MLHVYSGFFEKNHTRTYYINNSSQTHYDNMGRCFLYFRKVLEKFRLYYMTKIYSVFKDIQVDYLPFFEEILLTRQWQTYYYYSIDMEPFWSTCGTLRFVVRLLTVRYNNIVCAFIIKLQVQLPQFRIRNAPKTQVGTL